MNPAYSVGDWLTEDVDGSRHTIVDVDAGGDRVTYALLECVDGDMKRYESPEGTLNRAFSLVASEGDSL